MGNSSTMNHAVSHPFLVVVFLVVVLVSLVEDSTCTWFEPRSKLAEFSETIERARPQNTDAGIKNLGRVFYPIGYGADPTGKTDSFGAIMDCIKDAVSTSATSGYVLSPGLIDVGGLVIDLLGGEYLISQPLGLPYDISNLMIRSGTLRALSPFPGDRHLIELQAPYNSSIQTLKVSAHKYPPKNNFQKNRFDGITFQDMLFDSSFRGGGIQIFDSARIRVNHCFFIHFTTQGVNVNGGHEIYISNSFFGQQLTVGGGGQRAHFGFEGTAIKLRSADNAVTNVVIFSVGTGIEVDGRNNILTGVHCYNIESLGGVGILVRVPGLSQTRIDNCYMDGTAIVVQDPFQVTISNCFFLRDANIVLVSTANEIGGLTIVNNMFYGSSNNPIVDVKGSFSDVTQVVIDRNNVIGPMQMKSTVGRLTVSSGNGSQDKWVANFSDILVFPNQINHLQYSFLLRGKPSTFPLHSVTQVKDNVVVVESDQSVQGMVSVMVDQFNSWSEGGITMNTYGKP